MEESQKLEVHQNEIILFEKGYKIRVQSKEYHSSIKNFPNIQDTTN